MYSFSNLLVFASTLITTATLHSRPHHTVQQGKSTQQFWELYELFHITDWHLDGVLWSAILRQLPKMLGLFFVVTFGSCLDVAAIQADMPFPIDFNGELATVGLSNMIVGLSGGQVREPCAHALVVEDKYRQLLHGSYACMCKMGPEAGHGGAVQHYCGPQFTGRGISGQDDVDQSC